MRLTAGHKRLLQWVGYPLLALVTFVCAAWASFDAERLRAKAVSVLGRRYDASIESIDKGILPGNFTAYGVVFKTRPTKPDEKPMIIVVDELEADIGLFALLGASLSVDVDAQLGGGSIEGEVALSSGGLRLDLATTQLDVGAMPGLKMLFAGLPVDGGLDASIDLEVGKDDRGRLSMAHARGTLGFQCPMCTVGPGKVVPRMKQGRRRTNAFAKEGVTLPQLNLGDNTVSVTIEDGRGTFGDFEAVSPDGEIYAEGYIDFKTPLGKSEFHHCYRFKFSDKAKKKNAKLEGMERGMERARRTDGYIGMRMTGTFDRPKRIGSRSCKPGESPADIRRKRQRARRKQRRARRAEREAERAEREANAKPELDVKEANPEGAPAERTIKLDRARDKDASGRPGGNNGNVSIPAPRTSGPPLGASGARTDDVKPAEPAETDDGDEADDGGDEDEADDGGDEDEVDDGDGDGDGDGGEEAAQPSDSAHPE